MWIMRPFKRIFVPVFFMPWRGREIRCLSLSLGSRVVGVVGEMAIGFMVLSMPDVVIVGQS